jgi:putative membrane protein
MITYNPKDWFKLIFFFHKSDTFRILFPTMLLLGLITAAACYVEKFYLQDYNVPSLTIFHQISGFIISLVLVFRINTAYDRWWEGRKQWGALVNNARTLALKLNAIIPQHDKQARRHYSDLITNFPFALKEHLRGNVILNEIAFSEYLKEEEYVRHSHKPNLLVKKLTSSSLQLTKQHEHSPNDFLILSDVITQFTDICGACERIKNTPIPYSYSIFIKKIIFLYVITMPLAFGMTIGYWAIPIVMIIFYAFASLELISEEIEDPFGTDSNDLPTDDMSARIKLNVEEILLTNEA